MKKFITIFTTILLLFPVVVLAQINNPFSLQDLANVKTKMTQSDNDLIAWDSALKKWVNVNIISVDYIDFNVNGNTCEEGRLLWNDDDKTLTICTEVAGTSLQVGQEMYLRVTNKTGSDLVDGDVVYVSGAQGNRPTVTKAQADEETTSYAVGVVTQPVISNNATGYVTTYGLLRGFDTRNFTAGDPLFLSATEAGEVVTTPPASPYHAVFIGFALNSLEDGIILINPHNGYEITELHDVQSNMVPSATGNVVLKWDDANGYWTASNEFPYTRHIQIPALITGNAATAPTPETVNGAGCLQFASSLIRYVYFQFEVGEDWDGVTDWIVEVDWIPDSGAMSGDDAVKWDISYLTKAEGETLSGTQTDLTLTNTDDNAQYLIVHSPVTMPTEDSDNPMVHEDHIFFEVSRDTAVANDFAGTVCVTAFELIYNSIGLPETQ